MWGVTALLNLAVRYHHSKNLNEDECGGTRAEGVPEIPVVDRFGVVNPQATQVLSQGRIESRVAICPTVYDVDLRPVYRLVRL